MLRTIYLPAIERRVSLRAYVAAIKVAKANPDLQARAHHVVALYRTRDRRTVPRRGARPHQSGNHLHRKRLPGALAPAGKSISFSVARSVIIYRLSMGNFNGQDQNCF